MSTLNHSFEPIVRQILVAIMQCPDKPYNVPLREVFDHAESMNVAVSHDCKRIEFEHTFKFSDRPFKVSTYNHWTSLCKLAVRLGYSYKKDSCRNIKIPDYIPSIEPIDFRGGFIGLVKEAMKDKDIESLYGLYQLKPDRFNLIYYWEKVLLGLNDGSNSIICYCAPNATAFFKPPVKSNECSMDISRKEVFEKVIEGNIENWFSNI